MRQAGDCYLRMPCANIGARKGLDSGQSPLLETRVRDESGCNVDAATQGDAFGSEHFHAMGSENSLCL